MTECEEDVTSSGQCINGIELGNYRCNSSFLGGFRGAIHSFKGVLGVQFILFRGF